MLYYTDEARARIVGLGAKLLEEFVQGVPPAALERHVLRNLPPIDGFRAGSAQTFKEQKKRLLQRLQSPESHKGTLVADWRVFVIIWLLWTEHNVNCEGLMEHLRTAYRDKEHDDIDAVEASTVEICTDLANEKKASKEVLRRFVQFSPFATEAFAECLGKAIDQRTLESFRLLDELPERLSDIDREIEELGDKFRDTLEKLAAFQNSGNGIIHRGDLTAAIAPIEDNLAKLEQTLSNIMGRQESMAQQLHSVSERFAENSRRLADLGDALKRFEERSKSSDAIIEDIRKHADVVDGLIDSISSKPVLLESISNGSVASHGPVEAPLLHRHEIEGAHKLEHLVSAENILPHLYRNLLAIGISTQSARQASSELTAGILSGQLIMLSGSLAELLADALIKSLSAQQYLEAHIPLGFSDARQLATGLTGTGPIASLLCIRSLNFSSFELYGAPVRSLVLSRQMESVSTGPVMVATVASGPVSLPLSTAISELGPVLDTDSLTWKRTAKGDITLGQLQTSAFGQTKIPAPDAELIESVDGAIRESQVRSSEAFSRTWRRAIEQLLWLTDKEYDESLALDSLFSSWIVPYLNTAGVAPRTVSKACSRFATNGGAVAGRLASAMANGVPAKQ